MKYTFPLKKVLVFSQWSRKSYAVFASLGKTIKIARISVAITDKGLFKKTSLKSSINDILCNGGSFKDLLSGLLQVDSLPDDLLKRFVFLLCKCVSTPSMIIKETKVLYLYIYNVHASLLHGRFLFLAWEDAYEN